MLVGARGFGERDLIQSYVYARSDGDDAYEVTRFVNVFVTGAAERTFTATGPYNLFSSAQDKERVNGEIHNGSQGSYKVEIPRFSQRLIVHKSQVNGPRLDLAFEASPPQLTTPLAFEQLIELQGNTIYVWEKRGASRWRRSPSPEHTIPVSAWSTDLFQQHQVGVDTVLRSMLVQRLRLKLRNPKLLVPVPGHHVFFGLLPTLPASFRLGGPQAGLETGRSILHFDVYEPLK
jgi:hypothetical protein